MISKSPSSMGATAPSAATTESRSLPFQVPRRLWWALPIVLASAIGSVYMVRSLGADDATAEVTSALPVDVTVAEAVNSYTTERTYTGELVAERSSNLGFERTGSVATLLVDEGDRVVAGQPLARLDTRALIAQREQVEAQRQTALAQLRELQAGPRSEDIATAAAAVAEIEQELALARLQRDRRADLYAQGAVSREEFDQESFRTGALESRLAQAQSQLAELEAGTRIEQLDAQAARVSQLESSLGQIDVELDKSMLIAPFEGEVNSRLVDEGTIINPGQTVLELVAVGPREIRIGVPPAVADRLRVGSKQQIIVGDRTTTATLTALLPQLEATSRTVTAILQVPSSDLTLGQTVRLVIEETQPAEGIWLPTSALVPGERGLWSVYVLTEPESAAESASDGVPETYVVSRREVTVVHTDGDRSLVQGTLQTGEPVIAAGTHRIVPGERVQPTSP